MTSPKVAKDKAGDAYDATKDGGRNAVEGVKDFAASAADKAGDAFAGIKDFAAGAVDKVGDLFDGDEAQDKPKE